MQGAISKHQIIAQTLQMLEKQTIKNLKQKQTKAFIYILFYVFYDKLLIRMF